MAKTLLVCLMGNHAVFCSEKLVDFLQFVDQFLLQRLVIRNSQKIFQSNKFHWYPESLKRAS